MARPSLSQRRAEHIVERSGGNRIRRGHTDRLEVGGEGLFERTEGTRTLRVGGTLAESTGGTHTTRAKRVERTVRGHARIEGRTDNIILGGGMSEVHAGAEVVLAGMSDDLVIGAGARVTALLDLWVAGLHGVEEKLATANADGAFVDTARTLFEREYGTGVHHAATASFSGAVYATQATGFRQYMKVASGVRNLSSGGGGGGGESAAVSGPSTAAPSPGGESGSGLLRSAQTPSPGTEGFDSTDVGRLAGEAQASESVRLAEMNRPPHLGLEPDVASNLTAVEAHGYLAGLQAAAVQANDIDEANRLQDLINGLEHYAFDRYTTALADAEAFHAQTPAKLGSSFDANALANRLTALAEEQMALADSRHLSDEERHHAGKLSVMYMLAAQDTTQGLDPLVHIQEMMNSGLDKADAAIYSDLASGVSGAMYPGSASATRPGAARSLWARAGEIAAGLFASLRRWDSRPGTAMGHADSVPEGPGPIRFLDSPPGPRVPDPEPLTGGRPGSAGATPCPRPATRGVPPRAPAPAPVPAEHPVPAGRPASRPARRPFRSRSATATGRAGRNPPSPARTPGRPPGRTRRDTPALRSAPRHPARAGKGDYPHPDKICLEHAISIVHTRPPTETRAAKPKPYRRAIMKPRPYTVATREGFLSFPVPPPAGRWHDLYRRYAVAALGSDRAEKLLREVREGSSAPPRATRA